MAGALQDINRSIELDALNAFAYKNRALVYIEQKEFDLACTDLQTALDLRFTTTYGNEVKNLQLKYCDIKD